ncbi:hypothetical protein A4H97_21730 [Niastella yeongjuensis]|uniref:Uncharacterized protein n=1 Tax=Niastella yeongjuensis TaxID=354355 RepID=A0A1V9F8J5_9BACT|nr:hypothetical protein [Niastella yeongjuensis]OQP54591.1 hypothetical protein A4H97_21730 [Niastella yeongjuensis]SEO00043.1 hypothetical protein SAMN05660816_01860 [Niastella yeongjuensis]
MVRIILVLLLLVTGRVAFSQSISGSWYGKADVMAQGVYNNYLTELVLKQKGNSVEGVFAYYFKDSYQSFFVRGTYDQNTRQVRIKNLPMLFYRSTNTQTGAECMMDFEGTLRVSQVKSSMSGSFVTIDRYKYTCPQMRVSFTLDVASKNLDSMLSSSVVGKRFWLPQREDVVVKTSMPVVNGAPNSATVIGTSSIAPIKITDSAIDANSERNLVAQFSRRKIIYTKELEITSDSIRISLYDNGEIDGDTVTVFLNGQPVMSHQELTARAVNIYLTLDNSKDVNEVSLFAENLGRIPPNTALMVVTDGISRYEVFLSSSYTQNATVRIKKRISRH